MQAPVVLVKEEPKAMTRGGPTPQRRRGRVESPAPPKASSTSEETRSGGAAVSSTSPPQASIAPSAVVEAAAERGPPVPLPLPPSGAPVGGEVRRARRCCSAASAVAALVVLAAGLLHAPAALDDGVEEVLQTAELLLCSLALAALPDSAAASQWCCATGDTGDAIALGGPPLAAAAVVSWQVGDKGLESGEAGRSQPEAPTQPPALHHRSAEELEAAARAEDERTLLEASPLRNRVSAALACRAPCAASPRRRVLDVLAGAPFEFWPHFGGTSKGSSDADGEAFHRLPRLAYRAATLLETGGAGEAGAVGVAAAEAELAQAVLHLASTGGGWPPALRQRLLAALNSSCEAAWACSEQPGAARQQLLGLEIDSRFTSPGATSTSWLHQALLDLGAATGLPALRARAAAYRSRPPEVVLSASPAGPAGDCFALRGPSAAVALRFSLASGRAGGQPPGGQPEPAAVARYLVIEQPPRWNMFNPRSLPRRFSVYGDLANSTVDEPYTARLGNFKCSVAAPSAQAFRLDTSAGALKGLRLVFEGPGWGGSYICIYRIRVVEVAPCEAALVGDEANFEGGATQREQEVVETDAEVLS